MDADRYDYETLSALGASSPAASTATDIAESSVANSSEEGPYIVFRNEISLLSSDSGGQSTAAIDYISLDDGADAAKESRHPLESAPTPSTAVEKEPELVVENGWFRSNCRFNSPMLQLHKEILDFCDFLSPTSAEASARNLAVETVSDVIKYIWPNCRVEVFGSFKTGLYLPSSDIDVVILGSNLRTPQIGLQALSRALSQRGVAKKIQVIGKARIPIVKFVEKTSGVSFDVSFDVDNGPKAAEYIEDAMAKLPPLRPLCLILKVFLQQRELNEVYSGGVGSYALLTMLISLLRIVNEGRSSPEHNLGILLIRFFEFYAHKLNTCDVGVSCNRRGTFFLKSLKKFQVKGRPFLISIEDPQAPENDIGKGSFNYFQIRSAFQMAYSTLTNIKTIMSLGPDRSMLGTIIRPDPVLLERKGGVNGDMTFSGLLPGAGEPVPSDHTGQDIVCNWQMNDEYEEEPLPRGGGTVETNGISRSTRRKRLKRSDKSSKKTKENGIERPEGDSEKRERSGKRTRWVMT